MDFEYILGIHTKIQSQNIPLYSANQAATFPSTIIKFYFPGGFMTKILHILLVHPFKILVHVQTITLFCVIIVKY
jgi:hypothetical protein